jgi:hypothetical protein
VDESLALCNARLIRVDEQTSDTGYRLTTVDFADDFSNGEIHWWSDRPDGLPDQDRTATVDVEGGKWVARNLRGEIL